MGKNIRRHVITTLGIGFLLALAWGTPAFADSLNKHATTCGNVSIGAADWQNCSNSYVSDNSRSIVSLGSPDLDSNYLYNRTFDFSSIPSNVTINGISVSIERSQVHDTGITSAEEFVKLEKSGSAVGTNKGDGTSLPETTDGTRTFGSSTDLWGTTWSRSDITNIGIEYGVHCDNCDAGTNDSRVDAISITIYYTVNVPAYYIGHTSSSVSANTNVELTAAPQLLNIINFQTQLTLFIAGLIIVLLVVVIGLLFVKK